MLARQRGQQRQPHGGAAFEQTVFERGEEGAQAGGGGQTHQASSISLSDLPFLSFQAVRPFALPP